MKVAAEPKVAYVDTSCIVAIALGERGSSALQRRLSAFDEFISSNLLEAELKAALVREGVEWDPELLSSIAWVFPDRSLRVEIDRVLASGYLRGADCWHVATALYVADDPADLAFVTLDNRQNDVAKALGFAR